MQELAHKHSWLAHGSRTARHMMPAGATALAEEGGTPMSRGHFTP